MVQHRGIATYRLDIVYEGSRFRGWATQPGQRTVQGELEGALERLLGEPVMLSVAGRTDAGVHALGQVASFTIGREPPSSLVRGLNALTGSDVAVLTGGPTAADFDARRTALSRRYRYRIEPTRTPSPFEVGRALSWPHRLDVAALKECARLLVGIHDFRAFTPTRTEHVRLRRRVLDARFISQAGDGVLMFEIEADSFLRRMVRTLVGTMLEVAAGRREHADFRRLLTGAPRAQAGDTAPAHGLYLLEVRYPPQPPPQEQELR